MMEDDLNISDEEGYKDGEDIIDDGSGMDEGEDM